jgi:uroporphyrin-III C-methyltransferase/precorrin-2 dehydrogenase/sirohydrochlorin ferrochelatase
MNPTLPPTETRARRIAPLTALPVFLELKGRRVVVAGEGEGAIWKAELAAAAGADVVVCCPAPPPELIALAAEPPAGTIAVMDRSWQAQDLDGAAVAIGALEGQEAEQFAAAARKRGVLANIVDSPGRSDFSFGTIVNRAPVTIAIGTGGSAPVLGQAIRARIEAVLHPALGDWAAAARSLRQAFKAKTGMGESRRALWRRFADAAMVARAPPSADELKSFADAEPAKEGSIALVGAGPGAADLVTLKAMRALQSADVVLYDRLVSAEILDYARREAQRILVGKAAGAPSCRQDDINALMVKLARDGKRVVRLKGGDPLLFGRAAEELAAARAAGLPIEVVPGITAALGAAAELKIPLTDRRFAKRLQLVTGHSEKGVAPEHDWHGLADAQTTTVFYMGSRTLAAMLPRMLAAGLDPATPAVAVLAATTASSTTVNAPIAELPDALRNIDQKLPCLILVGRAIAAAGGQQLEEATT